MTKVYGVGLPRCAGQSLQLALNILGKGPCLHSPGNRTDLILKYPSSVEVFLPVWRLLTIDPDALFIVNMRRERPWLDSCARVYKQSRGWNHPLWKYPLSCFSDYRHHYLDRTLQDLDLKGVVKAGRVLHYDFTASPTWVQLCSFFKVAVPDVPFPRHDPVGSVEAHSHGCM